MNITDYQETIESDSPEEKRFMNPATFQYKCLQCGKLENGGHTGKEFAKEKLNRLLMGSNIDPLLHERYVHSCDESRTGIMQLIGYKVEG